MYTICIDATTCSLLDIMSELEGVLIMGKHGRLVGRLVQSVDRRTQATMRRFVCDIDRRLNKQNKSRAQHSQSVAGCK